MIRKKIKKMNFVKILTFLKTKRRFIQFEVLENHGDYLRILIEDFENLFDKISMTDIVSIENHLYKIKDINTYLNKNYVFTPFKVKTDVCIFENFIKLELINQDDGNIYYLELVNDQLESLMIVPDKVYNKDGLTVVEYQDFETLEIGTELKYRDKRFEVCKTSTLSTNYIDSNGNFKTDYIQTIYIKPKNIDDFRKCNWVSNPKK